MTTSTFRKLISTPFLFLLIAALPLAAQTGTGSLKVKTSSNRTGIFVDGKYLGPVANFKVARKYSLPAGSHEVILREPRFEEAKATVQITAGKTTTLKQDLKPRPAPMPPFGELKTSGFEKYSAVFLNGGYVGHSDEFDFGKQGLLVNPGEYEIEITSPGGANLLKTKVTIQKDKIETVKAK